MSTIKTERLEKILSETQAVISECNSRGVHGSVEVNARLFENVLMELLWHRAAMHQGTDGNSLVVPDGWVPCSERMPSVGEKVLAYRPDAPESNDPLIKMAKYVGKSAHGHGFDCYCKPSHWMLLPSAPQHEVK